MRKLKGFKTLAVLAVAGATHSAVPAAAQDMNARLVIDGTELATSAPAAAHLEGHLDNVLSGWLFRDPETRAMQTDDFDNPGMVFVDQAMDAWNAVDGTEGKSCASCHGDVSGMKGVQATYPKWNEAAGEVRTTWQMINECRETRMGAKAWSIKSGPMAFMQGLIALQSRGMAVDVKIDGPAQATWETGKEIYYTRYGQLELACASCHEANFGNHIRSDYLSQGQTNGFPAYRLKNAALNTVQDRFWGCIRDTRGQPFDRGSPEFVALELYVASRGNGLAVEGPSVRN